MNRNKDEIDKKVKVITNVKDAFIDSQAIAIITEWDEFRLLDWEKIYSVMKKPAYIFDGRNILDKKNLSEIGFIYKSIGRE